MKLPENTNYEAFTEFLKAECVHETVYNDSEGRTILVIELLDAFSMAYQWGVRMVSNEREACAQVCEELRNKLDHASKEWSHADLWDVAEACAETIRARGEDNA
jgi:hypothetical protein